MDSSLDIDYPHLQSGFISFNDHNGSQSPQYYELASYLINELGLKTVGRYNWIFNEKGTHYKLITDEMLGKIIIQLTQRQAKPSWLPHYFRIARQESQIERESFKSPNDCLNLENGVLNIKKRVLVPHKKSFNFNYITPIKYDEDAKCPNFMQYLDFVFEGDQELINVTSEIFGYCLLGGDPFLHKSFVLLGDGRNGKSTWLHVLRKLLGDDNCSSVSMGLLNKPFSAVRLDGKLANITGELPTGKLDSEIFKSAVGGEHITASHKGKDEYGLQVQARFLFACNDMPRFGDTTTGMWEKLFIIPFNRLIKDEERDKGIYARLESELSGILNYSLDGLDVLLQRGRLPKPSAVTHMMQEYRKESDSVFEFFNDSVKVDVKYSYDRVHLKSIYKAYLVYCSREGVSHPVQNRQFSKRMRRIIKERYSDLMYIKYQRDMIGYFFTGIAVPEINNLTLVGR